MVDVMVCDFNGRLPPEGGVGAFLQYTSWPGREGKH